MANYMINDALVKTEKIITRIKNADHKTDVHEDLQTVISLLDGALTANDLIYRR